MTALIFYQQSCSNLIGDTVDNIATNRDSHTAINTTEVVSETINRILLITLLAPFWGGIVVNNLIEVVTDDVDEIITNTSSEDVDKDINKTTRILSRESLIASLTSSQMMMLTLCLAVLLTATSTSIRECHQEDQK